MIERGFRAFFRFYAELNDFLPPGDHGTTLEYAFAGRPSVKDAIEAQGIPHTEVDLIVAGGKSVGFDYHLQDGDSISVYPVFESIDISPVVKLRDKPLRNPRFILDVHLGKLARLMRLMGFDSHYRNDYDDPEIVQSSVDTGRIILTRDKKLLHARVVTHGYWLRSFDPEDQLEEVILRFDLKNLVSPYSRCLGCNSPLAFVPKTCVLHRLEPKTRKYYHEFFQCSGCSKIFWRGSHSRTLSRVVDKFRDRGGGDPEP